MFVRGRDMSLFGDFEHHLQIFVGDYIPNGGVMFNWDIYQPLFVVILILHTYTYIIVYIYIDMCIDIQQIHNDTHTEIRRGI